MVLVGTQSGRSAIGGTGSRGGCVCVVGIGVVVVVVVVVVVGLAGGRNHSLVAPIVFVFERRRMVVSWQSVPHNESFRIAVSKSDFLVM